MILTLESVKDITHNTKAFRFMPDKTVDYTAGQFLELHVPHEKADNRGEKRWYTISSAPKSNYIEITTKFYEQKSSFKTALLRLKPGDKLRAMNPIGDFTVEDPAKPVVFIAGGIGITPFKSMLDQHDLKNVTLIHLARTEDDFPYSADYQDRVTLVQIPDQPKSKWKGHSGNFDKAKLEEIVKDDKPVFYVSGPPGLVKTVKSVVQNSKFKTSKIKTDYFAGY